MAINGMLGARLGGLRQWVASGGFASDPSAFGRNFMDPNTETVNLEGIEGDILSAAKQVPGPVGTFAKVAETGIRGANASVVDRQLEGAGFKRGLSFGQQLGAAFGFNSYGGGGVRGNLAASAAGQRAARDGQGFRSVSAAGGTYRTSPSGPTARLDPSGRDRGRGGAAERDPQGHGGGGRLGGDRDKGFGGPR